jgi:hypothetical protein
MSIFTRKRTITDAPAAIEPPIVAFAPAPSRAGTVLVAWSYSASSTPE